MSRDPYARGPLDPVVAGLSDGANAGYDAVELVVKGLHEGLRRQGVPLPRAFGGAGAPRGGRAARPGSGTRSSRAAAGPPPRAPADRYGYGYGPADGGDPHHRQLEPYDPFALFERLFAYGGREVVNLVMDVLEGVLSSANQVTQALLDMYGGGYGGGHHGAQRPYEIRMRAYPGRRAHGDFRVWNTSGHRMSHVGFVATDLLGPGEQQIAHTQVSFEPKEVDCIHPREQEQIEVSVHPLPHTAPGHYRGLVRATVGDAWAVLDLEVAAALDP